MARPGQTSRGQLHVGRYLGVLAAIFAILYSTVIFAGSGSSWLKPKLGLDLQGGAQVILTPEAEGGKKPNPAQLAAAVDILRQRVNGAGVSEAEVVIEGDQIVVQVPGGNRESIATVTKAAQLQFRRVVELQGVQQPVTTPTSTSTVVPSTSPAAGTPKPTATTNKRPITTGLLAATPSPTPTPTPTPSPTAATAPGDADLVLSGAVYTPANFAALDCTNPKVRAGGAPDLRKQEIVACDRDGSAKYRLAIAKVVGEDVKGANVGVDQATGVEVQVNLQFKNDGQDKWTKLTEEAFNQPPPTDQVAIVLDGVVISAPSIKSVINGDAQITGGFTRKQGQELANNLKFGALPLSFKAGDAEVVSASLGEDQLRSGLLAGGIGLIAVVVYSLLYYRALGLVTIASLLVSAGLVYGSIVVLGDQIGFALSLAGIAGLIVSVGITADSFVVFFERLKDEIKEGRTPRSAVDRAWVRARRTILSADTVSLLAAVILYFVSVGGVRGFAFTLGLSTLLDVVVVFLFTRPLLTFLSRFRWFSHSRYTGFFGPDGGEPAGTAPRKTLVPTTVQEA